MSRGTGSTPSLIINEIVKLQLNNCRQYGCLQSALACAGQRLKTALPRFKMVLKYATQYLTYSVILVALLFCNSLPAQDSYDEWLKKDQQEFAAYEAEVTKAYGKYLEEEAAAYNAFLKAAGRTWGKDNVWVPEKTTWVQYREDWEERSSVQCEAGIAKVEVIVDADADDAEVQKAVADAVETLVLSGSISPIEMMRRKLFPTRYPTPKTERKAAGSRPAPPSHSNQPQVYTYTVQKGDNLWKLSRKFRISRKKIADANGISPDDWLKINQKLKIPVQGSELRVQSSPAPVQTSSFSVPRSHPDLRLAKKGSLPMLARQLKMPDGTEVSRNNARRFAEHIAANNEPNSININGSDGKTRRVVKAQFPLVPDHVRIRAERFRPLVTEYARKEGIYAPLVYAIMHSESSFNPRARSGVPAYGLMQLVPRSGARDAYRYLYKKDKLVSGSYLYNPENNIQLGVAFLHILDKRYFRRIEDPMSRMLCSIAAYNTGAGNVCKAFGAGTSLSRAAPIINRMEPAEVYSHLHSNLPYTETRHYIKKVSDRIPLYSAWK